MMTAEKKLACGEARMTTKKMNGDDMKCSLKPKTRGSKIANTIFLLHVLINCHCQENATVPSSSSGITLIYGINIFKVDNLN